MISIPEANPFPWKISPSHFATISEWTEGPGTFLAKESKSVMRTMSSQSRWVGHNEFSVYFLIHLMVSDQKDLCTQV